jgi:hypothetical protein
MIDRAHLMQTRGHVRPLISDANEPPPLFLLRRCRDDEIKSMRELLLHERKFFTLSNRQNNRNRCLAPSRRCLVKTQNYDQTFSIRTLERESEGREDGVSSDPVFDVELMEPPGAEVDLLGPGLERVAEQRPDGRHASPESAELIARAVVIRHLLLEVAADARGKAQRKMLIDRPFEMQLGAALVICRRVGRVERQAKRARDLEAGLQTEVRIGPPCRLDHGQASGETNRAGDRSHGGPCRHRAEPLGAQRLGAPPSN